MESVKKDNPGKKTIAPAAPEVAEEQKELNECEAKAAKYDQWMKNKDMGSVDGVLDRSETWTPEEQDQLIGKIISHDHLADRMVQLCKCPTEAELKTKAEATRKAQRLK